MKRFLHLSISVDGTQLRDGTLNGVNYIICPCISKLGDNVEWPINAPTPEFIPASVLALATQSRNNRPVVIDHPQDENGTYISANDPKILEKYSFGHMFAAKFEDNKVQCEIWLDPERAKIVGKDAERVIERLQNGETVEVSEGDYVISEEVNGEWNGKEYGAIWVACWSDHLAALPEGSIGACSVEDGCGALRSSMQIESHLTVASKKESNPAPTFPKPPTPPGQPLPLKLSALNQARKPTFTGTETSTWTKPTFADYVKYLYNGDDPPMSVAKCLSQMKKDIAAHTLLGDPDVNNFADLTSHAVVNPSNGYLNEKALRSFLNDANDSVKEMVKRLLNSEFSANLPDKKAEVEASMDKKPNPLKRILDSMANTLRAAMSNNDLRWKLYKALEKVEPGISFVHDEDVATGEVLYCTIIKYGGDYWEDAEREYHNWKRTFTIDDKENVAINDDAIEIEWYQGWKPLGEATPKMYSTIIEPSIVASCSCQKGEKDMNRSAVVARLSKGPFAGNVKALEAMDDKALESLDKTYPEEKKEEDKTTNSTPTPAPTPTDQNTVSLSKEEHTELIAMRDAHRAQEAAKKSALVTSLKTAQTEFTEVDLNAMEIRSLERMSRLLKVDQPVASGNYVGLPIPRNGSEDKAPPVLSVTEKIREMRKSA